MRTAEILFWMANAFVSLCAAPLLPGIVNKTKAFFAGRRGPSVFQLYYDIFKLLKKSTVRCDSATWLFRCAPYALLAALFCAVLLMPAGMFASPFAFFCDAFLLLYLFGLGRVVSVLAAMETGSSFEGMGASRECQFSALAEVPSVAVFLTMMLIARSGSLSGMLTGPTPECLSRNATVLILLCLSFFLVTLMENCRVPADDPETHLELTMIHEAMILDNSGPDLAVIFYNASLKLYLYLSFLAMMAMPRWDGLLLRTAVFYAVLFLLTVAVGVTESVMARYRFLKVHQIPASAFGCAALALALLLAFGNGGVR